MTGRVKLFNVAHSVSFLSIIYCAVALLLCVAGAPIVKAENIGSTGSALTGGTNDTGAGVLNANVVVLLTGAASCTGTLLTPTLVLTARHCITGNAGGFTTIISGIGRTPIVNSGSTGPTLKPYTSVRSLVFGDPVGGPFLPSDPKTIPENMGTDIAVVFLDPNSPVLGQAIIKRIEFRGPILGGDDVNGGIYKPAPGERFGIAGWSPTGSTGPTGLRAARQVALFDTLGIHHYPGKPEHTTGVADGQFWLRNLTGPVTWPGDSGSPVFIQHADGSREVFGVLSGSTNESEDDIDCSGNCAVYTDITRGAPKEWLLSVIQDKTRSAEWLRFHKRRDIWFGEVDYTGQCEKDHDFDCDGWYDENDFCPGSFDPEQVEGAACPPLLGFNRLRPAGVTAIHPRSDEGAVSLYVVGLDGKVWSNFWPARTGSDWNGWFPIGTNTFPQGSQISAIHPRSDEGAVSLYVVGLDGKVWSNFWPARTGSDWNGWFPIGDSVFPIPTFVTKHP